MQDGKAFIATELVKAKINPIPACDKIAKDADSKSDKAQADCAASGLKNEKPFDESTRPREQGNRDFRKCFGGRARREGFFSGGDATSAVVDRSSDVEMNRRCLGF